MSFFKRRVVVTGMGVVTPVGVGVLEFSKGLKLGKSAESDITRFDLDRFPVKRSFEIKDFNSRQDGARLMDPFIQYALRATTEALETAHFDTQNADPYSVGISVSSSKGGVHTIDRFKERFEKHPSAILGARIYTNTVPNFAAQWIARRWKLKGPAKCYVSACSTGTTSVIEGARMVGDGEVEYCIAGASDASIVPLMLAGYSKMKVLSKKSMLPFDKRRDGFLVGEGAGVVFLETFESAKKRGAVIFGEILGCAYGQETSGALRFDPKEETLSGTLKGVQNASGLNTEDIDYLNVHGTGTIEGDLYETQQMKQAFGREADSLSMSSTKSMTGHMLGASGAVEIITCLIAMKEGFIPPTAGLEEPDPKCDLDYTPLEAKTKKVYRAISFSAGFGGQIAAIALGKVEK